MKIKSKSYLLGVIGCVGLALPFTACSRTSDEERARKNAAEETKEAVDATKDALKESREAAAAQIDQQLKALEAKMDAYSKNIGELKDETNETATQKWNALKAEREKLAGEFNRMKSASQTEFETIQAQLRKSLATLETELNQLSQKKK